MPSQGPTVCWIDFRLPDLGQPIVPERVLLTSRSSLVAMRVAFFFLPTDEHPRGVGVGEVRLHFEKSGIVTIQGRRIRPAKFQRRRTCGLASKVGLCC